MLEIKRGKDRRRALAAELREVSEIFFLLYIPAIEERARGGEGEG